MNETVKIEVPVTLSTAAALSDEHRLAAVGRLIDRILARGADDPLGALLERTAADAQASGLTDQDIEDELAAYNAERRG